MSHTKILPVPGPEQTTDEPARYSLNLDRCVIEVSVRPLGLRLARARFRARDGDLVITGQPPVASIRIDIQARPDRVGIPLAARFWATARRQRFSCTAADIDVITTRQPIAINGEVDVNGPWLLPLTVRFVHVDEHAVVLAARGPVRSGRTGRWLWVEAAVEFTR